jgi:plasmid stabilization system protein ParE
LRRPGPHDASTTEAAAIYSRFSGSNRGQDSSQINYPRSITADLADAYWVVILESAEDDIREIRRYVVGQFGQSTWSHTWSTLKQTIRRLSDFPDSGSRVDELRELNMAEFRQAIFGLNRVIYRMQTRW